MIELSDATLPEIAKRLRATRDVGIPTGKGFTDGLNWATYLASWADLDQLDHWPDYAQQDGFVLIQPELHGLFVFISFSALSAQRIPHEATASTIRIDPTRAYWKEFATAAIKVREMIRPHLEPALGAPLS